MKRELKVACNPHFGSIFRTHRDEDGISNRLKTSLFKFVGDTGSTLRTNSTDRLREMRIKGEVVKNSETFADAH